jgi:hypothetical protein
VDVLGTADPTCPGPWNPSRRHRAGRVQRRRSYTVVSPRSSTTPRRLQAPGDGGPSSNTEPMAVVRKLRRIAASITPRRTRGDGSAHASSWRCGNVPAAHAAGTATVAEPALSRHGRATWSHCGGDQGQVMVTQPSGPSTTTRSPRAAAGEAPARSRAAPRRLSRPGSPAPVPARSRRGPTHRQEVVRMAPTTARTCRPGRVPDRVFQVTALRTALSPLTAPGRFIYPRRRLRAERGSGSCAR